MRSVRTATTSGQYSSVRPSHSVIKSWSISLISFFLDTDECALATHDCDANAVCSNTKGSYKCDCIPPYYGDGGVCAGNLLFTMKKKRQLVSHFKLA